MNVHYCGDAGNCHHNVRARSLDVETVAILIPHWRVAFAPGLRARIEIVQVLVRRRQQCDPAGPQHPPAFGHELGRVRKVIDRLEEDDDVQTVWGNYEVSGEVMEKLA